MIASDCRPLANVLGIHIDALNMSHALAKVLEVLKGERKGYVCVAGVHGVMEAQRSAELAEVYARSEMTIPDGMPLVWVGHLQGHQGMERVTGPDLMLEIFGRQEFVQVTHFLCGGAEGVAEELRHNLIRQFPRAKIVGTWMPPFHALDDAEQQELIGRINACRPDIVWIGMGCPKQEIFMARYLEMLDTRLMIGVGAAFDFHTGRIRDCSDWVKRAGLQWLHRLLQDPRRLWRRYLRNNPAFLWRISGQLLSSRVKGRPVEAPPATRKVHAHP